MQKHRVTFARWHLHFILTDVWRNVTEKWTENIPTHVQVNHFTMISNLQSRRKDTEQLALWIRSRDKINCMHYNTEQGSLASHCRCYVLPDSCLLCPSTAIGCTSEVVTVSHVVESGIVKTFIIVCACWDR